MTDPVSTPVADAAGWRDIATAPKDTDILLFFDCSEFQTTSIIDKAYWDDDLHNGAGGWLISCECEGGCFRPQRFYTHWQPLPPPPESGT